MLAGQADTSLGLGCCLCGGGLGLVGLSSFLLFWWWGLGVACCRVPGLRALVACSFLVLVFPAVWWVLVLGGCGLVGCELYSGCEHCFCLFVLLLFVVVCLVLLLFVVCLFCSFCLLLCFGLVGCVVVLGVRWMPWHWEPMKDVVACDMPRGAGLRAVIRGFPNGGTRHELCRVTCP